MSSVTDCVLCGKCLEVCPLLAATGREELSPRAKAHLASLLERDPELLNEQEMAKLAELCLGCGRCRDACSQGVDVPDAVSRLREKHPGWKNWLWKQWMGKGAALWPTAGKIADKMPESVSEMGQKRLSGLVKMARSLGRKPVASFLKIDISKQPRTEAILFPGCSATFAASYWTSAAQSLCTSLNVSLIEADFSCCGAGLQGAGLRKERLAAARRNVDIWRAGNRPRVITFCASCHAGLAGYVDERSIFPDRKEAETWATALLPLSGLLNSARFVVSPLSLAGQPRKVVYHRPCHGRGEDTDQPLIESILSNQCIKISNSCCGFGGIMQLGAPQLARKVSGRCWEEMNPPKEALVLTGCTACVFQLAATAPEGITVAHWLECLQLT